MSNYLLTKALEECSSHIERKKLFEAFLSVAESERKRIFAEAEKKKVEADCISTGYHCSPDEVVKMEDLKEICRIKNLGDRFNDNGNEFEVVSEPSLDGRVYARQICKVDSNAELKVKNEQ